MPLKRILLLNVRIKMAASQSAVVLNRSLSIRFWMAEKGKTCEIYRRMCDVNGEKMFPNRIKNGFVNKETESKRQFMELKHKLLLA